MLNLDTHILIFALEGRLTAREERRLTDEPWSISAIVLWEIAKLSSLHRIEASLDTPNLVAALRRIRIWPVDLPVCRATLDLDFSGDPADELIAATSIVHRLPLLTRDRSMRRSKRVPLA
jgi:PIN domain nuclease of toxin-antitoxin system